MNIYKKFKDAKELIQKENYQKAEHILKDILQHFPDNKQAQAALDLISTKNQAREDRSVEDLPYIQDINLISELYQSNQFEKALSKVNKIIDRHSDDPNLFYIQGCCFQELQQLDNSITSFQIAIKLKKEFALPYSKIGNIFLKKEEYRKSKDYFTQALSFKSDDFMTLYGLGLSCLKLKQYDQAIDYFEQCLDLKPDHFLTYNSLGVAYKEQGQYEKAIDYLKQALDFKPDYFHASLNLADIYISMVRYPEALHHLSEAKRIQPESPLLLNELGVFYQKTGELDLSLSYFQKAIEYEPDNYTFLYNLSFTQLKTGNIKEGALNYEYRWKNNDFPSPRRTFTTPKWNGEDLTGKKILIWSEQGIGDEIMYASIIPEFEHLSEKVVIECSMKLALVFQWAFPWAEVKATGPVQCENIAYYNQFDYQIPSGSLMRFFRHSIEDFKQKQKPFIPRLKQGEQKVRDNLKLQDNQLLIGLCWRSSLQTIDRSISYLKVEELAPLKSIKNATFLAVQYDDCLPELDQVRDMGLSIRYYTNIDQKNDLGSSCALLGACDLVISAGTAVAQLSASLGVPTVRFEVAIKKLKLIPWHPTMQSLEHSKDDPSLLTTQIVQDIDQLVDWANQVTTSERRIDPYKG